ncbi:hypothetical protein [Fodinicola acaciae]|uniref:hypothetical protein n=1 Tax=Fodinicola acaciae TaxID=2681555 RepID=UPI0013D02404|nr:hypothetical protein [Fodinicola acaciae]
MPGQLDLVTPRTSPDQTAAAPTTSRRTSRLLWILVLSVGLLAGAAHLTFLLSQGRNLWLFDSRSYLYFTLRILGADPYAANQQVHDFSVTLLGVKDAAPIWDARAFYSFAGRPLYSLLSAPFVALFGVNGMFVVPFLAYAAFVPAFYALLRRLARPVAATLAMVLLLVVSPMVYAVTPLAESLSLLTATCWLFTLPWPTRSGATPPMTMRRIVACVAMIVLANTSRQLITFACAFAFFVAVWAWRQTSELRDSWWKACAATAAGVLASTVVINLFSHVTFTDLVSQNTEGKFTGPVQGFPYYAGRVALSVGLELRSLVNEQGMLVLALVAVIGAVLLRRTIVTALVAAAFTGYLGTLLLAPFPTSLRLFLPSALFVTIAAAIAIGQPWRRDRDPLAGNALLTPWTERANPAGGARSASR